MISSTVSVRVIAKRLNMGYVTILYSISTATVESCLLSTFSNRFKIVAGNVWFPYTGTCTYNWVVIHVFIIKLANF